MLKGNKEHMNLLQKRAADSIDMNKQFIFGRGFQTKVTLTIVGLLNNPLCLQKDR